MKAGRMPKHQLHSTYYERGLVLKGVIQVKFDSPEVLYGSAFCCNTGNDWVFALAADFSAKEFVASAPPPLPNLRAVVN